jgi:hypothetical protein
MTTNQKLRAEADRRRAAFLETASSVSKQMRPAAILDKVVGVLDSRFAVLKRIKSAAKRSPFAVLAAVGGVLLLSRQLKRGDQRSNPVIRRDPRAHHMTRSTLKGDDNGYINDAEQQ